MGRSTEFLTKFLTTSKRLMRGPSADVGQFSGVSRMSSRAAWEESSRTFASTLLGTGALIGMVFPMRQTPDRLRAGSGIHDCQMPRPRCGRTDGW